MTDAGIAAENWADSYFYGKDDEDPAVAHEISVSLLAFEAGYNTAMAEVANKLERMGLSR